MKSGDRVWVTKSMGSLWNGWAYYMAPGQEVRMNQLTRAQMARLRGDFRPLFDSWVSYEDRRPWGYARSDESGFFAPCGEFYTTGSLLHSLVELYKERHLVVDYLLAFEQLYASGELR